jgi:hypothetical protein
MDELRRLLRARADANVTDYDKQSPLHIAAAEGNLPAVRGAGGPGGEGGRSRAGQLGSPHSLVPAPGRPCLRDRPTSCLPHPQSYPHPDLPTPARHASWWRRAARVCCSPTAGAARRSTPRSKRPRRRCGGAPWPP